MNTIFFRIIAPLLVTAALLGLGYSYGKVSSAKKYEPKLAALQATLDQAAQAAKVEQVKQKETQNAIQKSNNANIAAIRARYERMLRYSAASDSGASTATPSTSGVNATSGEQAVTGCGVEFEQACILDANKVTQWQDWAKRNHIPVAE